MSTSKASDMRKEVTYMSWKQLILKFSFNAFSILALVFTYFFNYRDKNDAVFQHNDQK